MFRIYMYVRTLKRMVLDPNEKLSNLKNEEKYSNLLGQVENRFILCGRGLCVYKGR